MSKLSITLAHKRNESLEKEILQKSQENSFSHVFVVGGLLTSPIANQLEDYYNQIIQTANKSFTEHKSCSDNQLLCSTSIRGVLLKDLVDELLDYISHVCPSIRRKRTERVRFIGDLVRYHTFSHYISCQAEELRQVIREDMKENTVALLKLLKAFHPSSIVVYLPDRKDYVTCLDYYPGSKDCNLMPVDKRLFSLKQCMAQIAPEIKVSEEIEFWEDKNEVFVTLPQAGLNFNNPLRYRNHKGKKIYLITSSHADLGAKKKDISARFKFEREALDKAINALRPNVVFQGSPRLETWGYQYSDKTAIVPLREEIVILDF